MAFIVKRDTIVIPAGIPVSTNSIIINGGTIHTPNTALTKTATNTFALCNFTEGLLEGSITFTHRWNIRTSGNWIDVELGIATKKTSGGSGRYLINASNGNSCSSESMSPTWVILYNSGDEYGPSVWTIARNPSQDFNNIPTAGWIIDDPADAASITITSA